MTKRIRLLTSIAGGPCRGSSGDEVTVPDDVADVYADGVRAELINDEPKGRRTAQPETTARAGGPENTARRQSPRRERR